MTTFVVFNNNPNVLFQFNASLDGANYTVTCPYNISGQRYYINISNNFGNLIMSRPIIGSPDNIDINLVIGYFFTSTLVYRTSSNSFEINP